MLIGKKTIGTIAYMGGVMALPEPFVWSWTQMIQYNSEFLENEQERIHYNRATVSYHSFARNSLVDSMQGDWLLMLDTDHQFEPDIALRMLNKMNTYNIDVLAAPYLYKSSPHPPVLYGYDTKKKEKYIIADWDKENNPEIMPIYGAGAGCLMVRKKVFDEIKVKTEQGPFEIYFSKKDKSPLSEDHSFFERLHDLGIQPYVTLDLESPHLIYKKLSLFKDYDASAVKMKKIETFIGADSPLNQVKLDK